MPRRPRSDTDLLLVALQHPLRRTILRIMADEEPSSPSLLADELDESLSDVSYHVRALVSGSALKPNREEKVRGATQHFYRWSLKPKWAQAMLEETED